MLESTKTDKAVSCKCVKCFKQRVRHKQAFVSTSVDTNTTMQCRTQPQYQPQAYKHKGFYFSDLTLAPFAQIYKESAKIFQQVCVNKTLWPL